MRDHHVIMGIDPGTTSLGISSIHITRDTLDIARVNAWTVNAYTVHHRSLYKAQPTATDLTAAERIDGILKSVVRYLNREDPSVITVEEPFMNRFRPGAFGPLVIQVTMIKNELKRHYGHVPIIGYPPMTVKAGIGARKMKGKEPVLKAVLSNREIMDHLVQHPDNLTEHSIDAIACAFTYIKKVRIALGIKEA